MLKSLITSETRIKLLLRFFLNPNNHAYLRQLSKEFNESSNGIRVELNRLVESEILQISQSGNNKLYSANRNHPLFSEIRNIVLKSTGIENVISEIIRKIGELQKAFIRGDYAKGIDSGLIELVLVGNVLNKQEIERVRSKTENLIQRKISVLTLTNEEFLKLENNFKKETTFDLL